MTAPQLRQLLDSGEFLATVRDAMTVLRKWTDRHRARNGDSCGCDLCQLSGEVFATLGEWESAPDRSPMPAANLARLALEAGCEARGEPPRGPASVPRAITRPPDLEKLEEAFRRQWRYATAMKGAAEIALQFLDPANPKEGLEAARATRARDLWNQEASAWFLAAEAVKTERKPATLGEVWAAHGSSIAPADGCSRD